MTPETPNNRKKPDEPSNFDVALVGQRAMGITHSGDPKPVLATQNLNMCVALHGYDENSQFGFLCHIDFACVVGGLQRLAVKLASLAGSRASFDCTIAGGKPWSHAQSPKIRDRIREELRFINSQGHVQFNITHETPMPNRWSRDALLHRRRPYAYCLDTRTGKVRPFLAGKPSLPLRNFLSGLRFDYLPY